MAESGQKEQGNSLLNGITEQAEQEAERIRSEAERQAEEIVKNAQRKAEAIRQESRDKGEHQADVIRQKNSQNIEAEQRKRRLKAQEELFALALKKIRESLQNQIGRPEYSDVLRGWVVEGAVGLGQEDLLVNATAEERKLLTDTLLKQAEKKAEEETGRRVKISLSKEAPLQKQGVFLTTGSGRLAFNNTVEARMQRYSTVIRKMIYRQIQTEEQRK
ncbi:MAG: V-type ATP synthase subunit E [Sediminispirochaetaceae bacterium]